MNLFHRISPGNTASEATTNVLRCPELCLHCRKPDFDYFMGSWAAFIQAGDQQARVRMSSILLPSLYVLSGDSNWPFDQNDADPDDYSQDTFFAFPSPIHSHRVNVLFADNHVRPYAKFIPAELTLSYSQPGVPFY